VEVAAIVGDQTNYIAGIRGDTRFVQSNMEHSWAPEKPRWS
jgi:hypothetical protein